jgi:hypothetical protein
MNRVTRRYVSVCHDDLLGAFCRRKIDRQNLVGDAEQGAKGGLYRVAAIYCHVAVQNFLQDFRIRDQSLAVANEIFEHSLRVGFVRVRCADKIHWDIRIN